MFQMVRNHKKRDCMTAVNLFPKERYP